MKVIELFGGIGAIRKAYINSQIPFEIVDYVEIDKNCVKSYNALYKENYEPRCICNYSLPPDKKIDLLMHGSPCQDFSRIGEKLGGKIGSGTRSSLLFETIRIIEEIQDRPRWVIWENVKGVLDRKMRASFFYYLDEMERLGYETKYETLNSINFGIPQKRERIFAISYLGKNPFKFENLEHKKTKHLADFLERDVMERYGDIFLVKQPSMLKILSDPEYKPQFQGRLQVIKDFCYTISTKQVRVPNSGILDIGNGRYRYLTERECFRLMGFEDSDFDKLIKIFPRRKNCMSSILYKQSGNSIVVNVLEEIVKEIENCSI
ncbi:DNA cytosine methyltransferase [Vagococcus elongatus]|uniref:Cytosine-specific methyltransferase n=1 Tax=Vagococcus elongatus TaxID=180344 RepID=A0A430ATB9_9ENTE|nr:DNA (cytosine-5-)-methyltransferase [Vagococcus elongatus]RSU11300.1 DNA (cytosine-5-)-methyltransferase [Vagococcus elongatus]